MPRPGVDVVITDAAAVGGTPLDSGRGFQIGLAERGPVDSPIELRSLRAWERACGPRIGGAVAHDSARAFFMNGGSVLTFLRLAGLNAHAAEGEVGPLRVSATSPGTWGNSLAVSLEADTGLLGRALAARAASSPAPKKRARVSRAAGLRVLPVSGVTSGRAYVGELVEIEVTDEDGAAASDLDSVDWGDGTVDESPSGDLSHTYTTAVGSTVITATKEGDNGSLALVVQVRGGTGGGDDSLVRVVVRRGGNVVERSQLVGTVEAAVGWADAFSAYVSLDADDYEADLEVTAPVDLTGGVDDRNITAGVVGDTLDYFDAGYGPGQVAYPGATDAPTHYAILDHCERMRRCALLDLDDTDELTIAADVTGLYPHSGARFAAALAPRLRFVGPASGTTILLPYSAAQMGVIARRDRATGNPNDPAAGEVAYIVGARGLAREFTTDTREELNELGVTLARASGRPLVIRTYGSRTCAGPNEPNWKWFGGSRVVMAITHEADAGCEQFVHRQIDPQRRIFVAVNSVLTAICERYFALGALYGETAEEAYQVDTSDAVNTDETIEAGEIHGLIRLATSPPGEWVLIEIAKQTTSLVAA